MGLWALEQVIADKLAGKRGASYLMGFEALGCESNCLVLVGGSNSLEQVAGSSWVERRGGRFAALRMEE